MTYKSFCRVMANNMTRKVRRIRGLGLVVLSLSSLILSGCHTTAGLGQDVKATGQAVTRGAQGVQSKM